jgi:hypothetical protein
MELIVYQRTISYGGNMGISLGRRQWLVNRLRRVAAEEEAAGAKEVAADFLRRAQEVEAGVVYTDRSPGLSPC